MKFKRLSTYFWRVETKGVFIVGTWDECQKEIGKYITLN